MADIQSIDMRNGDIMVNLKISEKEYALLRQETKDLVLLPTDPEIMDEMLTTGKLGNSNRIMMPKKYMERHSLKELMKRAPSKIFKINGNVFLLVKLKESGMGVPKFE